MAEPLAAPFPYFGGKRRAAPMVWGELGDPAGYIEPFAGSAAVLLARPAFKGRRTETINDADGWLVNTWRAIQLDPAGVASHAWGPVSEIDYHARLAWLQERRTPDLVAWLEGDPEAHDAKAAGWWLYVMACGIGDPFGQGPWRVIDGRLTDTRTLPDLDDAGRGVHRALPHLGNAGRGVNRALPHLGDAGRGVNRELPHLGNAGQGVNRDLRDPGDTGRGRLEAYLRALAARLSAVRIACGSWERVVTPAVTRSGTGGDGARAVFLDPPYATSGDLYAESTEGIAEQVRAWCITAPAELRIVLCGYDDEHDELLAHGWEKREGKAGGAPGTPPAPTTGAANACGPHPHVWATCARTPSTLGRRHDRAAYRLAQPDPGRPPAKRARRVASQRRAAVAQRQREQVRPFRPLHGLPLAVRLWPPLRPLRPRGDQHSASRPPAGRPRGRPGPWSRLMTPTRCAQCGREYQPTPDGIRRRQMLSDPPHRPCPEDGLVLTGQWPTVGRTTAQRSGHAAQINAVAGCVIAPQRIQLSRKKGWRKPEGAIVVARPSKWGNPYTVGGKPNGLACVPGAITGLDWEREDRVSAAGMQHDYFHHDGRVTRCTVRDLTRAEAVLLYREALTGQHEHFREPRWAYIGHRLEPLTVDDVRRELAGHDLACWCPLDQPCHADVLLEIANGGAS